MTITIGARFVNKARLHVPWIGRWVLIAHFDGPLPSDKVTVQWGKTALVGSIVPTKSGTVLGSSIATIVGGAGWHQEPPETWLVDTMADPTRIAQQLAQAVGETISIEAGSIRQGRAAYSRARQQASKTITDLLSPSALWWVDYDGNTQTAIDRPRQSLKSSIVLNADPTGSRATLDIEEPSEAPIGGEIADGRERFAGPRRIRELDMEADEHGVRATATFELPNTKAPRLASLVSETAQSATPEPHATWRAAAVQSVDAQRRVSLRLDTRDRELPDPVPVPAWCGVPGVSAEVYGGTRTMLAFDYHDPSAPLAALWSPHGQTGHVPKKVYHEAAEEIRFVGSSPGVVRVGALPLALAHAIDLQSLLGALQGLGAVLGGNPDPSVAAVGAALTSAVAGVTVTPTTRMEAE